MHVAIRNFSSPMRRDLHIYNEATGMTVASASLSGKGIDSDTPAWQAAFRAGQLIPMELFQDDPFNLRLVLDEALSPPEDEEWVGRIDWKLCLPDGRLLVCGGSEYIMQKFDEPDEYLQQYAQIVEVPPGDYRASLLIYFNSVNGRECVSIAKGGDDVDPLGKWFRATRPGEKFPDWLHNACVIDPAEDPGFKKEWKRAESVAESTELIDFILHLTPLVGEVVMPDLPENGWFSEPPICRVPVRIPLGIAAEAVERSEEATSDSDPAHDKEAEEDFWGDDEKEDETGNDPSQGPELLRGAKDRAYHLARPGALDPKTAVLADSLEREMLALGFTRVCELELAHIPYFTYRAFVSQDRCHWGGFLMAPHGRISVEFVCRFGEWPTLTTSNIAMGRDQLFRDCFHTNRPGMGNPDLWKLHGERAAFLSVHHGPLQPFEPTPETLASHLERASINREAEQPAPGHESLYKGPNAQDPDFARPFLRRYFTVEIQAADPRAAAAFAEADAEMAALAFEPIGDVVGTRLSDVLFRGYASKDRRIWAKFMFGTGRADPAPGWELVSLYSGGAVLLSQRGAMRRDDPKRKIYRILSLDAPIGELHAMHRKRLTELVPKLGEPTVIHPTLATLARELEDAVERMF